MKRISWIGWLLAGLLIVQNAAMGLAAPDSTNPLEGHLLQHSNGSFYVYHDRVKFTVQLANTGDQLIDAIPGASQVQWNSFFSASAPQGSTAPANPEPFPASYPSS